MSVSTFLGCRDRIDPRMRLTHRAIQPAGRSIAFTFDGRDIAAIEGETIASALSAAGIVTLRHTAAGAPRGLHCGIGACFDCVVTIDGRLSQRACMTQAVAGMDVRSAADGVPADPAVTKPSTERQCDVLVVGGGVAGLSAAIAAAQAGLSTVLLDERARPGGQFAKPLAQSHRHVKQPAADRQFRLGLALVAQARAAGATVESGALVWAAFAPDEIAALIDDQSVVYRPRRLILATGAHEAPVPIPGWTMPGVMTTGGLQTLVRAQRVCPGERVLIAGNGPLNLQLACELVATGVKPVAVLEAAPRPHAWKDMLSLVRAAPDLAIDGLRMVARLKRAGVPVLWGRRVDRLEGEGRVQRALSGADRFDTDVVALNHGFLPEVSLARSLGCAHRVDPVLATVTDAEGRTSIPAVFAVGDGATFRGARVAAARGQLAGLAVARDLGRDVTANTGTIVARIARHEAFQAALWRVFDAPQGPVADETIVCRCEEVTAGRLRAEIAGGLASIAALKKATRAGMGLCQGRYCAATVARLCPAAAGPDDFAAPRAPVRPVPIVPLMHEAAEFTAPLLTEPAVAVRRHVVAPLAVETRRADVAVIGSGAAGLSTAYFLARGGADVLLIDRDEAGMAASTANAGSLHVQLLSYDFTDATPPDGGPAAHTLPLAPRSIGLWRQIAAEAGEDLGIRTEGGLMLAEDEAAFDWLRRKSALERRCGLESHVLGQNELRTLAPAVSDTMLGADFVPAEGYGDPLRSVMALVRLSQHHGARLLRGAEVSAIERVGTGWSIATSRGVVNAGTIVNATGPWAARVGRMVGLDLPVTGTVQQVIVTQPVGPLTKHLIAVANRHLSLKQQANGSFLIGGGWFGGFEPSTGRSHTVRRSIEGNLWVCGRALPAVRGMLAVRGWTGINPAIDRAPLLGKAPGYPGFYNTVTANGYTLGPIVGQLTAEAILHREAIDPRFRLERF
jgi:D-hydroxyproline dehydrogenase subunit alpha